MAINSTSFTNTPQASDDEWFYDEDRLIERLNTSETGHSYITLDVMSDDLGGKAKQLFSVSDEAGNLLETYNALKSADGLTNGISAWEDTADGNHIRINNGKIDFDISAEKIQSLADGEAYQDTFIYAIRLGNGTLSWATVAINITGENDTPTDIALSSNTVLENAYGAVIGALTTTDVDKGDTHTYTVSDARFEIVNNELRLKVGESLNFESEPTVTITVTTSDNHNTSFDKEFTINVTDVNEAPTITSGATGSVAENAPVATVVYTATSADVDAGTNGQVSYSLTGTDAALLSINTAGEVTLKASADFETKASYDFNVVATDGGNLSDTKAVTVSITDVNEAPTVASPYTGPDADPNDFDNLLVASASSSSVGITLDGTIQGNIIHGSNYGDILNGVGGNDSIYGHDGDDTINGGDAPDSKLYGQAGADTIYGGQGADGIWGGSGNDIIYGMSNPETSSPPDGGDTIYGGSGSDTILGQAGNDTIIGGYGADTLSGGGGNDTFMFLGVLDTGDVITDFLGVDDTLDFSAISGITGNSATLSNTVTANSINYFQQGNDTIVWADTDGITSTVEFQVTLAGVLVSALTIGDFVL